MTSDPTVGRPGGEHRVLEPAGALPVHATRLDALADLWDGEVRIGVEAVVLTDPAYRRLVDRLGADPLALTAAFTEAVAERGGVGPEATDATVIGVVEAVGTRHPRPVVVGERVAVAGPAGALPLFAVPRPGYRGGRAVVARGHAVVPAALPLVRLADEPPELAAELARVADVPLGLAPGHRPVILGAGSAAGAVALAAAADQGRHVTAVVASLGGARLARALGAARVVVADLADAVATAELVLAGASARPDLVVLAEPTAAALAACLAPTVQVLTDPVEAPEVAAVVQRHASALGRGVAVHAGRVPVTDGGVGLRHLVGSHDALEPTLRWVAGLAPAPTVPDPEDP